MLNRKVDDNFKKNKNKNKKVIHVCQRYRQKESNNIRHKRLKDFIPKAS